LLATCTALGAIVATDIRMLARLGDYKSRIAPPNPFVARLVTIGLMGLYVTGAALIWIGLGENPDYLQNPKLQAKLVLVAILSANGVALHRWTFPRLARRKRLVLRNPRVGLSVAVPLALSNSLWLFCAFLGMARSWSFKVPMADVFGIATLLFAAALAGVFTIIALAERDRPRTQPDWIDALKRQMHHLAVIFDTGTAATRRAASDVRHAVESSFSTEQPVTGVAESRQDVPVVIQFPVNGRRVHGHVGVNGMEVGEPLGGGQQADEADRSRHRFL
jgi:hypothetical protein